MPCTIFLWRDSWPTQAASLTVATKNEVIFLPFWRVFKNSWLFLLQRTSLHKQETWPNVFSKSTPRRLCTPIPILRCNSQRLYLVVYKDVPVLKDLRGRCRPSVNRVFAKRQSLPWKTRAYDSVDKLLWKRISRTVPRAPAIELGDRYSEYDKRSFPPSIPSGNPQTRRPMLAFPKGQCRLGPNALHKHLPFAQKLPTKDISSNDVYVTCIQCDVHSMWRTFYVTCTQYDVHSLWRTFNVTCIQCDVHPRWRASNVACILCDVHSM